MDEEILSRLINFTGDVVLCIVLNDGRKMITNGEKILAGKIEGDLASFILTSSRELIKDVKKNKTNKPVIKNFGEYSVYLELVDTEKYLKSIGGELTNTTITVKELLEIMNDENIILVDVRSPREFKEETIDGAINIPLFLDKEHELIGKIYKKEGKDKAIDIAIEIIENGLKRILNEAKNLDRKKTIVVFCARGGMRSQTMALILQLLGFKVKRLIGGYKAFKHISGKIMIKNKDNKKVIKKIKI